MMRGTGSIDLRQEARLQVRRFVERVDRSAPIQVDLVFHPTHERFCSAVPGNCRDLIFLEHRAKPWVLHLCEQGLRDIWSLALQGWLEAELAAALLKSGPPANQCNFRRRILPLMPVTGAAENFIREIVDHIEKGLIAHNVTTMMMGWGQGLAQAHFHFFRTDTPADAKEEYESTLPHGWVRTHFLCQLLKAWLPLDLLAAQGIHLASELKAHWLRRHDFLLPEDRGLLRELAALARQQAADGYAETVVAMFSKLLPRLGQIPRPAAVKPVVH